MTNRLLEEAISAETIETIEQLFSAETENFSEQVKLAKLNIRRDFRHADLRGLCLDDSDLRGFDFTGADLEGATGKNVRWDESTILNGASLSGSVFAYEAEKQAFFAREPQWHSLYIRKQKEHWASNANWFSEQLVKTGPERPYLVEVAKAICDSTNDGVLRSQLLLALAPTFGSAGEHREFLIHNLAKHADNSLFVRTSIQTMAALYRDDAIVEDILKREIFNSDYTVREAAIKGLMESRSFRRNIPVLAEEVRKYSVNIRRMFVYRAAMCVQASTVNAVMEPGGQFAIDFSEEITEKKIERIAYARLLSEAQRRVAGRKTHDGMPVQPHIETKEVSKRVEEYRYMLQVLQKFGVPFVFAEDGKR